MTYLARRLPRVKITVLQRDGFPVPASDVAIYKLPPFQLGDHRYLDADDELLRCACRELKADIFMSTYYTRAPGVVNVVMIHDMIPELFGYDLSQPEWLAKQRVIETGDAFMCVSRTTKGDLRHCYPRTETAPLAVVPNGLDACFTSVEKSDVGKLRKKLGLAKDYLLMVGNRGGYKGGAEFIKALSKLASQSHYSVLCVGGEKQQRSEAQSDPKQPDIIYAGQLTDSELAAAYGGAKALVVPSKYEGFGLPVLEAMACGCPVIAEKSPAVAEVGGQAVYFSDLTCPHGVDQALKKVSAPEFRKQMIAKGKLRATRFNWAETADRICRFVEELKAKPSIILTAVVSTFNAARYIEGCLEDLERQTIAQRMEIIVVDSASEENEAVVVRDFQKRYANIKYMRTPVREKVYQAWNRGIKFALGKYVSNANTDDRHRHDAFEQMVHVLEQDENIALVYADVIKTRTANETFRHCTPTGMFHWYDWDRRTLLEKGCFIGPQPVWRKSVHQEYGYFDENYTVSADFEFWLRISQTNQFYHISKPLGLYMERPDSIEHANAQKKRQEEQGILQRYRKAADEKAVIGRLSGSDQNLNSDCRRAKMDFAQTGADSLIQHKSTKEETMQGGNNMQTPDTIVNAIEYLVDGGHKEAALWAMEKLVLDFPHSAQLHSELAGLAYEQADMSNALAHFKHAADLEPDNTRYLKDLGDYYYVVDKDAEGALAQYERVLNVDPNNIDILIMAGHLSVSLHRYAQGQQYYRQALDLDPDNSEVGRLWEKMNHSALDQKPGAMSADDLYAAAQTKAHNGDGETAISLLEQLLAQDQSHGLAHNDLGVLYYESDNWEAAQTHYEKAAALQPENETFQKNLADFYLAAMGDHQRAMQTYVHVLKLNPRDVEAILSCGQICISLGRGEDARDFINTALETEPWNENAQCLLQQLEQAPETTIESCGTDLHDRAKAKAAEGDLHGAIDDLKQYVAGAPDNASAHNDLGVLYFEAGDKNRALTSYEQAVQLDPTDHTYRKNLADFYLIEQGRAEEAMKLYLGVLEENPQDIESLIASGMLCVSLGQREDAKIFYRRVIEIEPWNEIAQSALNDLDPHGNSGPAESIPSAAAG
jgi:Flp pilus assembly protein TadD/glycosyltransferase involved in cell wall biosynthesis